MTAVSYVNPYAPQPINTMTETSPIFGRATAPIDAAAAGGNAGRATDHSGQGAGNGTGTGGAQMSALLKRARLNDALQKPTPESVIEARIENDPASEFLTRQAKLKAEGEAAEKIRIAERAAARKEQAEAAAEEAAEPKYEMPNPLPTAPILEREPNWQQERV